MKQTIFAFAATLLILAAASCKKDDDKATIQGKWFEKTGRIQYTVSGSAIEDTSFSFTNGEYLEFKSDNTLTSKDEDGTLDTYDYTYNEDTKVLATTQNGTDTGTFTVTSLTSSDMTLHNESTETDSGITYTVITDITLKR